jgi:hypothetical protein
MKIRPIYENLDTSFVNLSALLEYLRARRFVGRVRVEMKDYEAVIALLENDRTAAREHDFTAGQKTEGEEALQKILRRAQQPGGTIHVFQTLENGRRQIHSPQNGKILPPAESPQATSADFPFQLSNRVEARAKRTNHSPDEWRLLLRLTAELLGTIDKTLAAANLDFAAAFKKACAEIADDYPFLNPAAGTFAYGDGKITVRGAANYRIFAAAINEAVRRILGKLGAKPKFYAVHRETAQKILALIHQRRPLYDRFFITPQLEKTLGV